MILLLADITTWSAPVPSYWGLSLLSPLQWPSSNIRSFPSLREASEQGFHSCRHIYGTKYSLKNRHWRSPFQVSTWDENKLCFFSARLRSPSFVTNYITHKVNIFAHSMSEKRTHVRLLLSEWNQWSQGLQNITRDPEYESRHSLFLVRNANKNLNFIHGRQIDPTRLRCSVARFAALKASFARLETLVRSTCGKSKTPSPSTLL